MKNLITDLKISELKESNYIKPLKVNFTLNGAKKSWEAVRSHDSVSVLLYHKEKESFLLVKQFRVPVYLNDKNITYTYELCAGLVDKNMTLEEIDNRYDFKGISKEIDLNIGAKTLTLVSSSDNKIDAMLDIMISKMNKRGISINSLEELKKEDSSGGNRKYSYTLFLLDSHITSSHIQVL